MRFYYPIQVLLSILGIIFPVPLPADVIDPDFQSMVDSRQDAEIAELSRKIDALKLAIRCPCPRGGECICGEDCVCPNCPKHSKKKESTVVPSGLENQDDGIPFYGVSWKGTQPTNKGVELLFFGASWCTACPAAEARLGSAKSEIYYIDCTDSNPIAERYGINGFPYLLQIKDGRFMEGRAGDAVHEVAARDWLNGKPLPAGVGATLGNGKPSAPAATSDDFIPKLITKSSPQYSYARTGYNPVQRCSVTRLGGSRWTWPGNLGSHLSSAHGFNPAGFSHSQLVTIHDNFHNTGRSGVTRSGGYTSSAPYRTRSQPASYNFQPRVQFTSGYSYGTCPSCPR